MMTATNEAPSPLEALLADARRERQAATTERERAYIERDLWQQVQPLLSPGSRKRDWLTENLGGDNIANFEARSYLCIAEAEPFWPLIDNGELSVRHAVRLLREARQNPKLSLAEAVEEKVQEYLAQPTYVEPTTGKTLHRTFSNRYTAARARVAEQRSRGEAVAQEVTIWESIRSDVERLLQQKLAGIGEAEADSLKREFMAELNTIISNFQLRVNRRAQRDRNAAALVSRHRLVSAFHTLHLDPPRPNQPIDLDAVNRQKRHMARCYHPDYSRTEQTRPMFEAVLEAFAVIEQYVEQQKSNP